MQNNPQTNLLRLPDVMQIVRLSRPTIYRRIQEGKFPAQIKDGRCSLWREDDVRAYVAQLLKQQSPAKNQADRPMPA